MLSAFGMAFKTPELRKKIFFTLSIMALFRFGSVVPTPGVSYENVQSCLQGVQTGGLFGLINLFSGGALIQLSVFALGIMPYITASIIVQLLTVVIPRFETLKKEGQSGTAKLTQYTRYLTIGLAVLQSTGLIAVARTPGRLISGCNEAIIPDTSWQRIITMIEQSATPGRAAVRNDFLNHIGGEYCRLNGPGKCRLFLDACRAH